MLQCQWSHQRLSRILDQNLHHKYWVYTFYSSKINYGVFKDGLALAKVLNIQRSMHVMFLILSYLISLFLMHLTQQCFDYFLYIVISPSSSILRKLILVTPTTKENHRAYLLAKENFSFYFFYFAFSFSFLCFEQASSRHLQCCISQAISFFFFFFFF